MTKNYKWTKLSFYDINKIEFKIYQYYGCNYLHNTKNIQNHKSNLGKEQKSILPT
jgi:hypothetical protein